MKKVLLFLSLFAVLSSCKNMWSDEDKDAYMQSCMDANKTVFSPDQAKAVCTCRLDKLMKKYNDAGEVLEHMDSVMHDQDLAGCDEEAKKVK